MSNYEDASDAQVNDRRSSPPPLLLGLTPFHRLERLGAALGRGEIYAKRDDLTGVGIGGNKVRKLEYFLGDALARGSDLLVTGGALQSNHAALTATAASMAGLRCELALTASPVVHSQSFEEGGNRFLNRLSGTESHRFAPQPVGSSALDILAADLTRQGREPYIVPFGGSNPLGALGYVRCIEEIVHQAPELTHRRVTIVHATGSGGTQAGLAAGVAAFGLPWHVIGFSVVYDADVLVGKMDPMVAGALELLGSNAPAPMLRVDMRARGPAYGVPTLATIEAMKLMMRLEGIVLDPVYTAKAVAGMLDMVRTAEIDRDEPIIYVHTGGAAGLFGYQDILDLDAASEDATLAMPMRAQEPMAA